ncbi:hypothetical protein QYF61_026571 [Mycteria americana]|uniref:Uncharacterized protein n=1 Tax=Mycteria americana TaxID=33587 RepID=A0AAN7PX66_MYCAM|nr:hypothetical protein QYF61_026571 [Mycteria americana]
MNACTFGREQRIRQSRAHGSGEANKSDVVVGISYNALNQEEKTDKAFFEQLETGSEQTRTVPVFCNWKNLPVGKTSVFTHEIFTHKVVVICEVPDVWKKENVITHFKKGKKDDLGNYRLISLTSVPWRIIKKSSKPFPHSRWTRRSNAFWGEKERKFRENLQLSNAIVHNLTKAITGEAGQTLLRSSREQGAALEDCLGCLDRDADVNELEDQSEREGSEPSTDSKIVRMLDDHQGTQTGKYGKEKEHCFVLERGNAEPADLMKPLGDDYCLTIDLEYSFCTPSNGEISKVAET